MAINHQVLLAERPTAGFEARHFRLAEAPVPEPAAGQFRVRVEYVSLDPAMRGWVTPARSYLPPVDIGEPMRAIAAGFVEASRHPGFKEGDAVTGLFGVQDFALSDGAGVTRVDPGVAPLPRWLGGLGMPGHTAYFGLMDVARPQPGETVCVSAASGAVGQVVGQIARILGARAVGIAGGPDKCADLVERFGYDAAADYTAPDFADRLAAACPKGIDVSFENVGGVVMNTSLALMNRGGRIALCGLIAQYSGAPPPLPNLRFVLTMRVTMRGFIVFDFADRYAEATAQLVAWHREGKLVFVEDVREGGLAAFAATVPLLYSGGNRGKLVLKIR